MCNVVYKSVLYLLIGTAWFCQCKCSCHNDVYKVNVSAIVNDTTTQHVVFIVFVKGFTCHGDILVVQGTKMPEFCSSMH